MGPYFTFGQCGSLIFSQLRYALSRQSSIHAGSAFLAEISRMTSSFKPAGTTSDSMSVTKPYLYGCWTWASMLVILLPEVITGHKLGDQNVGLDRNPNGFVGITLVDVSIPLPNQPLVVLRRIQLVDDRRIVHGDAQHVLFVPVQDSASALTCRLGALQQLRKQRRTPDHRMTTTLRERWNDDFCTGPAMRFEDSLDGRDAHVRQIDRPDEHSAGLEWLKGAQRASERSDGARLRLRILHDYAVLVRHNRLDARRIRAKHHDSSLYLERFQGLEDPHDEGQAEEVQEGLRGPHSGRPASRQHDAR